MTPALGQKRILILVVAYNAGRTIAGVLRRIPAQLRGSNVEVLLLDDASGDDTFAAAHANAHAAHGMKVTILRTPSNQGYGGNQKLGYRYAIENGFDLVALLHASGQYAPEELPNLIEPLADGRADAVIGSRMLEKDAARRGGMPLYKLAGIRLLSALQRRLLRTALSDFHSGYRVYTTDALRRVPFERNSAGFRFDTEMIIQMHAAGLKIAELPIPTYYGSEIRCVNGLKYAWDVLRTLGRWKFHQRSVLFDRKFDVGPIEETYDLKLGFQSSHTMAIDAVRPGARVIDIGCGQGLVARELARVAGHVTGVDQYLPAHMDHPRISFYQWNLDRDEFPVDLSEFEQVFLLDIIEHLKEPDAFMERLRHAAVRRRPEIILTTGNVGFFITRLMLLIGYFNYGRKGILDRTHTRLFTFGSIKELLNQAGYRVIEVRGIPAPYPKAFGTGLLSALLLAANRALIWICPGLFAYQIFIRAAARPSVEHLLSETIDTSRAELARVHNAAPATAPRPQPAGRRAS